jgi:hypothetical protein
LNGWPHAHTFVAADDFFSQASQVFWGKGIASAGGLRARGSGRQIFVLGDEGFLFLARLFSPTRPRNLHSWSSCLTAPAHQLC